MMLTLYAGRVSLRRLVIFCRVAGCTCSWSGIYVYALAADAQIDGTTHPRNDLRSQRHQD